MPATHLDTTLPLPVYPALAKQSCTSAEAAAVVVLFSGQFAHVPDDSEAALYFPVVQACTPPPCPVYPASARQAVLVIEPSGLEL